MGGKFLIPWLEGNGFQNSCFHGRGIRNAHLVGSRVENLFIPVELSSRTTPFSKVVTLEPACHGRHWSLEPQCSGWPGLEAQLSGWSGLEFNRWLGLEPQCCGWPGVEPAIGWQLGGSRTLSVTGWWVPVSMWQARRVHLSLFSESPLYNPLEVGSRV